MEPDRSWMYNRNNPGRASMIPEFAEGVTRFINHAKTLDDFLTSRLIRCPCVNCENVRYHTTENVAMHLMMKGFTPGYTVWTSHGEFESDSMFNNFVVGKSSRSTEHNYVQGSKMSAMVDDTQEELFKVTYVKRSTNPTEEERWIEPRAQETYDRPLIQEETDKRWRQSTGEPIKGSIYNLTTKTYQKKKSWSCCSSSPSFDCMDREIMSLIEGKISCLSAELDAIADRVKKREERERKREKEIATTKEVDNKRYAALQAQLTFHFDSRKIVPPCPAKCDGSYQEGDENDKSDKESEGDEE